MLKISKLLQINRKQLFQKRLMSTFPKPLVLNPSGNKVGTIIFLHGLGDTGYGWEDAFVHIQSKIKGIKVVLPHAPQRAVTINMGMRMPAWYDIKELGERISEDFEGLEETKDYVNSLIQSEIEEGMKSENIILGGFSQGGACSLYTAYQSKFRLAGVIALSCYLPTATTFGDKISKESLETPLFMAHGDEDDVVIPEYGKKSFEILQKNNVKGEFKIYNAMGHSLSYEELEDVVAFIKRIYSTSKI